MMNKRPDLSHLKVFRSKACLHVTKIKGNGKFSQRVRLGYLDRFEEGNSFRGYLSEERRIAVSRDVSSDEYAKQLKSGAGDN